jgi:hypothetical protein
LALSCAVAGVGFNPASTSVATATPINKRIVLFIYENPSLWKKPRMDQLDDGRAPQILRDLLGNHYGTGYRQGTLLFAAGGMRYVRGTSLLSSKCN